MFYSRHPQSDSTAKVTNSSFNSSTSGIHKDDGRRTVLVSEDDSAFAKLLLQALNARGFNCTITDDSNELFSLFLVKRPNVVVISLNAQGNAKTIKATSDILRTSSRAEVVVLMDQISDPSKIEKVGVELFVRKNVVLSKIVNSISAVSNLKKPTLRLVST